MSQPRCPARWLCFAGNHAPLSSMPVLVMHVRRMRMRVLEPAMLMNMRVRFARGVSGTMLMPVVLVVHM